MLYDVLGTLGHTTVFMLKTQARYILISSPLLFPPVQLVFIIKEKFVMKVVSIKVNQLKQERLDINCNLCSAVPQIPGTIRVKMP